MTDDPDFARKYGALDMAPVRKVTPAEPLIAPAEWAEIDRAKAARAEAAANAVYLGEPTKPPLHADPLVCEVAEILMKETMR